MTPTNHVFFISPFITIIDNLGIDHEINVHHIVALQEAASGRTKVVTSNSGLTLLTNSTVKEIKTMVEDKLKTIQEFK